MKKLLILSVLMLLCIYSNALSGSKKEKVKASADILLSNISPEAARRKAFREAESHALESVIRELDAVRTMSTIEDGEEHVDLYRQNISSRTSGVIIAEDTLADTIITMELPDNSMGLVYHVEIEATIMVEEKKQRSPYKVKLSMPSGLRYEAGDKAQLVIDLKKESYLHIFNIAADNKVYILYPLTEKDIKPIKPGKPFVYPTGGYKMTLHPLPGHDLDIEEIRVLATKEPFQFFSTDLIKHFASGNYMDLNTTDLITLEMEILRIPYDERGTESATYEVHAK